MKSLLTLPALMLLLWSCRPGHPPADTPQEKALPAAFTLGPGPGGLGDYWYQGTAEVSHYELQQNRYADVHPGMAVAVFVTEDFLADEQVKNERYTKPNSISVLKMNMIQRFTTGLYDYSVMRSVFTPANAQKYPQTLKVSTSTQDWCGQVYMQLNYRDGQYAAALHSYFEKEADQQLMLPYTILEDELFNRIRMGPNGLPTGQIDVLPSTVLLRLQHLPLKATKAEATLSAYEGSDFGGGNLRAYTLKFPELKRELQIVFQTEEPYLIEGWTDTYPSMSDRKMRTTIARRTKTIREKYWQEHALEDTSLRQELGLGGFK